MATDTECSTIIPYYCATYWHILLVTVKIALAMQVKKSCFKSCFIIFVWPVWISFFKLSFHSFIFLHEQLLEYYTNENYQFPTAVRHVTYLAETLTLLG